MKKALLLITLAFAFTPIMTQTHFLGGAGYFTFGIHSLDLDKLNQTLQRNNYAQLEDNLFAIGGEGFFIYKRIMIGGEGFGFLTQRQDHRIYRTVLTGGVGLFKVGYVVYNSDKLMLYPMIGIGKSELNLKIVDKRERSFNATILNPNTFDATISSLTLSISGGVDFKFGKYGYFILGTKVGYRLPLSIDRWKNSGEIYLENGPKQGVNGFYIKLSIGGGGGAEVKQ